MQSITSQYVLSAVLTILTWVVLHDDTVGVMAGTVDLAQKAFCLGTKFTDELYEKAIIANNKLAANWGNVIKYSSSTSEI